MTSCFQVTRNVLSGVKDIPRFREVGTWDASPGKWDQGAGQAGKATEVMKSTPPIPGGMFIHPKALMEHLPCVVGIIINKTHMNPLPFKLLSL